MEANHIPTNHWKNFYIYLRQFQLYFNYRYDIYFKTEDSFNYLKKL